VAAVVAVSRWRPSGAVGAELRGRGFGATCFEKLEIPLSALGWRVAHTARGGAASGVGRRHPGVAAADPGGGARRWPRLAVSRRRCGLCRPAAPDLGRCAPSYGVGGNPPSVLKNWRYPAPPLRQIAVAGRAGGAVGGRATGSAGIGHRVEKINWGQLPDQSTTLWVDSFSTRDSRLRAARPKPDKVCCSKKRATRSSRHYARTARRPSRQTNWLSTAML
jgi:hypothetical protein